MKQRSKTLGGQALWPEASAKTAYQSSHPFFEFKCDPVDSELLQWMKGFERFVLVGMGGSVLPFRALSSATEFYNRLDFLDTVDERRVREALSDSGKKLYVVASKSGETLEVRALLSEILAQAGSKNILVATDSAKGNLRSFVDGEGIRNLPIPAELGGRFTHFTPVHRALWEALGGDFEALLKTARSEGLELQPHLDELFHFLFQKRVKHLVVWTYGESFEGLGAWMQQALAESLGKISKGGERKGVLVTHLRGPQDQHSVLQCLRDGPQQNALWFVGPPALQSKMNALSGFPGIGKNSLQDLMRLLRDSTLESFWERVDNPECSQPVMSWELEGLEDVARAVVRTVGLIEWAGQRLGINAFDQPGVERGKQIALELLGG